MIKKEGSLNPFKLPQHKYHLPLNKIYNLKYCLALLINPLPDLFNKL